MDQDKTLENGDKEEGMNMDLSFVPTEELLEEVVKRHETFICYCEKPARVNNKYQSFYRYDGDWVKCLGLCLRLIHNINCELDKTLENVDKEEAI